MSRTLPLLALLLLAPLPLRAADEPKPNTLTPKEIADGWILLFDGETTFGWQSKDLDKWTVTNGMLAPRAGNESPLVTTCAWRSYELIIRYKSKDMSGAGVRIGCDREGKKSKTSASAPIDRLGDDWDELSVKVSGGNVIERKRHGISLDWFNDVVDKTVQPVGFGHIALQGNGFVVRTVKLKPLDTKPLFNSKDLSGWHKFDADPKRAKSDFSVTKEGYLHLQNGPGDLQTDKEWADFVLQIECFCNGDKLNSGVFFRCRPGEYQNGYEAQIHHGFTEKPEKEYPIEEYDPETHKLTATKKVKYQATDYGTGGIYRRMPARRPVAKDKEWFTMTVVAQGRHIATWVNGIQTVDWTDNRPENDNARNGCKPGKGPISLQGHDATTDLNFRNIRIAELPTAEKK